MRLMISEIDVKVLGRVMDWRPDDIGCEMGGSAECLEPFAIIPAAGLERTLAEGVL
jgi:hypothetical protein